jgi:hypothetical protein
MGKRKNPQPKRIHRELPEDETASKRRRFLKDNKTTNVILADSSDPLLWKIPKFVQAFHDKLHALQAEYLQAFQENKADSNGWYRGYRRITGNRYEVKVLGDLILKEFSEYLNPLDLVRYAERQAKKDVRIESMPNHIFTEWSMIVSEECDAQPIHIDVPENNFQFGLILNANTKGTIVLNQHIGPNSPEDLTEHTWSDAPRMLKECMLQNESVKGRIQKLLNAYGPLLWPRERIQQDMVGSETIKSDQRLQCGDLLCTSGGIPHAGPASDHFRMVMFAAISPTRDTLYNVDDQYFAHSAILFAIQIVWDHIDVVSKTWLLQRMAKTVQEYEAGPIESHNYESAAFTQLMHKIADTQQKTPASNTQSIQEAVTKELEKFMKKSGPKSERELFQYRPPTIW